MGYGAASFGRTFLPGSTSSFAGWAARWFRWEADARRCVRQSTARWLLPVSRDIYGPAITSRVDQCHCNGGSRRPRSRCRPQRATRRAWPQGRHALAAANHGPQAPIGWRSTVSITSCASRGSRPLHSEAVRPAARAPGWPGVHEQPSHETWSRVWMQEPGSSGRGDPAHVVSPPARPPLMISETSDCDWSTNSAMRR